MERAYFLRLLELYYKEFLGWINFAFGVSILFTCKFLKLHFHFSFFSLWEDRQKLVSQFSLALVLQQLSQYHCFTDTIQKGIVSVPQCLCWLDCWMACENWPRETANFQAFLEIRESSLITMEVLQIWHDSVFSKLQLDKTSVNLISFTSEE